MKVFGIHGGGNIGLGLMADVINRSNFLEPYQIIATSNDITFNTLINGNHQFRLQHIGADEGDDTVVSHITMTQRNHTDIVKLYTDTTEIIALCLTQNAFDESSESIAQGLINRYKQSKSNLTVLVLMNRHHCDKYVRETISFKIGELIDDKTKRNEILERIEFIPTVSDRIVSKIPVEIVKNELKQQLLICMKSDGYDDSGTLETEINEIIEDPNTILAAMKKYQLSLKLFNAEIPFKLYAPQKFVSRYPELSSIDGVEDLDILAVIKDKYINGPHAILAWVSALFNCVTIAQGINYPGMKNYIASLMDVEIAPTLKKNFPALDTALFNDIKNIFFERCLMSSNDPVVRVGRDPLRKLSPDGRILGVIRLKQQQGVVEDSPGLERGIAAGVLYALKDKDPLNPDCKKMKEIYDINLSYADVLCRQSADASETHQRLDPALDGDLIHRILIHIHLLDKESTYQATQTIPRSMNFFATKGHMLTQALKNIGIRVNTHSGNIFYTSNFEPMPLDFELVFVRHGETFGNAGLITQDGSLDDNALRLNKKNHENRVFQGNVDTSINQLTEFGKQQAIDAAIKLENELLHQGWIPDIIFHSPLERARTTGLPFVKRNGFEEKYHALESITEMSFGSLENRRVCDIPSDHQAHSFYKKQHALIKCPGEDVYGTWRDAENFCQVLLRAKHTLQALNEQFKDKKVLMFSHSMFGAACCIMMGKGNLIEQGTYLAFDGKQSNGKSYAMPNATPFLLNVNLEHLLDKPHVN